MDKFLEDIKIAYKDNLLNDNQYILLAELFISFYERSEAKQSEKKQYENYLKYIFLGKHISDLLNNL